MLYSQARSLPYRAQLGAALFFFHPLPEPVSVTGGNQRMPRQGDQRPLRSNSPIKVAIFPVIRSQSLAGQKDWSMLLCGIVASVASCGAPWGDPMKPSSLQRPSAQAIWGCGRSSGMLGSYARMPLGPPERPGGPRWPDPRYRKDLS